MFGNMMLFFVALIWGVATVAHSASMAWIGPFTYTATRYALGSVFLFGVWLFVRKSWEKHIARGWRVGMCGGVIMFVACALTQHGIQYTTVGRAAFLMSLYVVFVPLAGIAIGQRIHGAQIVGAILATIGLYFLCMQSSFSLGKGEMWMLLGTAVFSAHILFVGRFASTVNAVEMALAGWVLLGQTLSLREIVGCAFMITGMIVTRTYGMIKEKHEHVWREVEMKP